MRWLRVEWTFRHRPFGFYHFDVDPEGERSRPPSPASDCSDPEAVLGRADIEDEIGSVLWAEGAQALIEVLEHREPSYRGKRILEVGSGTGVVGLALAADGADVVLTDVAKILPLLEVNCRGVPNARASQQELAVAS